MDQETGKSQDHPADDPGLGGTRRVWHDSVPPGASPDDSLKPETSDVAPCLPGAIREFHVASSPSHAGSPTDFELRKVIGKGGMGLVFSALQASVNRTIALKMIHPDHAANGAMQAKFLSEALIAGALDHPNVVPVHEVGRTTDGSLFYAMKAVTGISWREARPRHTEEENLEILLKVCDAVAFAHDHGIIHRDLKPENVMLGDYGEVFLMDWGLALRIDVDGRPGLHTGEALRGGTPSYMAPEMARCDPSRIGRASDIYLLGGILYEIITGLRPHTGKDVRQCIHAAAANIVQPTTCTGELVDLATRAMADDPADRFATVRDFQAAVRDYLEHAQSLTLAREATVCLKRALSSGSYDEFAEAVFGFRSAVRLWPGNPDAQRELPVAIKAYATRALENGDLDLTASLLQGYHGILGKLAIRVERARETRRQHRRQAAALKGALVLLALAAAVIWNVAYFRVRAAQRREAVERRNTEGALRKAEAEGYFNAIPLAAERVAGLVTDQAEDLLWSTPARLRNWEWGRLMYLCNLDLIRFADSEGSIVSVDFADDSEFLAAGGADGVARVWDTRTATLVLTHNAEGAGITDVALSPDGRCLAVVPAEAAPQLVDVATATVQAVLEGHRRQASAATFSRHGRRLATGGRDRTVIIWDAETGTEVQRLDDVGGRVRDLAFAPDGRRLAVCTGTGSVWDLEQRSLLVRLQGVASGELVIDYSPDGTRIITGNSDKNARIWQAQTGERIHTLRGHTDWVYAAAFVPGRPVVVTAGSDHTVRTWNADTGAAIGVIGAHSLRVRALSCSNDGRRVGTGGSDNRVFVWDVNGGDRRYRVHHGDGGEGAGVVPASDGRTIAGAGNGGTVKLWSSASGELLRSWTVPGTSIRAVAMDRGGVRLGAVCADGSVHIWSTASGEQLAVLRAHLRRATGLAFGKRGDQQLLLTTGPGRTALVWHLETGKIAAELQGHAASITAGSFASDGGRIVTASTDRTARIWSTADGTCLQVLAGHSHVVADATFSPDGELVATASWDETGRVWQADTGACREVLRGHADGLLCVVFSPDGQRIATGSDDEKIKIWEVQSGRELSSLRSRWGPVAGCVFSADGLQLVSTHGTGAVVTWQAYDWTLSRDALRAHKLRGYERWQQARGEGQSAGRPNGEHQIPVAGRRQTR